MTPIQRFVAWLAAVTLVAPGRSNDGFEPITYHQGVADKGWADGTLNARAAAEASRLAADLAFGWIETTANLGIELYDIVTVDGTDVWVVSIMEMWDRGRLRQRLELAEVNTYAVYQG